MFVWGVGGLSFCFFLRFFFPPKVGFFFLLFLSSCFANLKKKNNRNYLSTLAVAVLFTKTSYALSLVWCVFTVSFVGRRWWQSKSRRKRRRRSKLWLAGEDEVAAGQSRKAANNRRKMVMGWGRESQTKRIKLNEKRSTKIPEYLFILITCCFFLFEGIKFKITVLNAFFFSLLITQVRLWFTGERKSVDR